MAYRGASCWPSSACIGNLVDNGIQSTARRCASSSWMTREMLILFIMDGAPVCRTISSSASSSPYRLSTDAAGTGLGLGIARNIAHAHGGDLVLENRPQGPAATLSYQGSKSYEVVVVFCHRPALPAVCASQVEVLHWWTSGGEAKAVEVLKSEWAEQGNQWNDFAVQGGGGKSAMTVLKTCTGGKPAGRRLLRAMSCTVEWGSLGGCAISPPWPSTSAGYPQLPPWCVIPPQPERRPDGGSTGIHRVNGCGSTTGIRARLGLKPPPTGIGSWRWRTSTSNPGHHARRHRQRAWQLAVLFGRWPSAEG